MRIFAIACCALAACASLQNAKPERDIVVLGVSSNRNPELAKDTARNRALDRAAHISSPQGVAFVLDRSRGKPMLKLISQAVSAGVTPEIEPRKPQGARAIVKITRTDNELIELRKLQTVEVSADASGLDLAIAQERADRALYRDAILRFAAAKGTGDGKLYGRVRVVNYKATDTGDHVRVDAEIAVTFTTDAVIRSETQKTYVNEELEEVEPQEESR